MFAKRFVAIGLLLIVALVGILAACAAPTSTSTPTSTPTLTPTPTPAGPLAQVIAGAKKEGTVSVVLRAGYTPALVERLKNELKETFGVDLDIKFTPSYSMPKNLAQVITEYQTGATPTYDLIHFMTSHIVQGNGLGVFERVDWKPLLLEGSNPEVLIDDPDLHGAIMNYHCHIGLMYDPEKVRADEVPKTLSDLANPKWKGKVSIMNYAGAWARWAYILGKEKVYADLRGIIKNKAVQGAFVDQYNRYLLGETPVNFTSSNYLQMALAKGVPGAWQDLDFAEIDMFWAPVVAKAAHPNAAKLLGAYLASPAGAKLMDATGAGNIYYPGSLEYDLRMQTKKQGIPERALDWDPVLMKWHLGDEYVQWQNEVLLILQGG